MDQKEFIKNYDFKFKKKFGQNFLTDENVLTNIVKCSEIDKNTLVVEIGPGAGALTKKLVKVAKRVVAYEIDETLKPIINEVLEDKDNVEIIFTDFLKRNVKEDIKKYEYKKEYIEVLLLQPCNQLSLRTCSKKSIVPDKEC